MFINGKIVKEQKNYYLVNTGNGEFSSILKGVLKRKEKRLFVGDNVTIEVFNTKTNESIIRKLQPRKNCLSQPAVANIDKLILVISFKEPSIDFMFLDRFLFSSGVMNFTVTIVFNKSDLLTESEKNNLSGIIEYYEKTGYSCLQTSAKTGSNIDKVVRCCKGSLCVFAGPSGTGKSAILSKIFPDIHFKINKLSKNISRGVHTTTHTVLLKLKNGGYITDTPGFTFVNLPKIPEEDVSSFFPEINSMKGLCKFNNCIHENEPECAVTELVKTGEIMESRYNNYLKFYKAMKEKRHKDYRNKKPRTHSSH